MKRKQNLHSKANKEKAAAMATKIAELEGVTSAPDVALQRQVAEINAPDPEPIPPPVFKEWKIHKLEDLFAVDKDQADKVFYFLQYAIRKARLEKKILIHFTFSEQGGGRMSDIKMKDAPTIEDEEIDPLS